MAPREAPRVWGSDRKEPGLRYSGIELITSGILGQKAFLYMLTGIRPNRPSFIYPFANFYFVVDMDMLLHM